MTNRNIIQHETQTTCLGVMVSRCFFDSQHRGYDRHPENIDCSSSRCIHDEQIYYSNQRSQWRKLTREGNKIALYCYFRSNLTERGYRKRMRDIWTEFARFKTTNRRLADQVRKIQNNGWFSDHEILEIHQQIYRQTYQQIPDTVTETISK